MQLHSVPRNTKSFYRMFNSEWFIVMSDGKPVKGEFAQEPDWSAFRREMPVAKQWTYFDHAAVAPLCEAAVTAMQTWANDLAVNGDLNWSQWRSRVEEVRSLAAQLVGADDSEIALIRNTTEGVHLIAEGFPWKAGDNVVLPSGEFPTNLYPWLNLQSRGVETRIVPVKDERLDLNQLEEVCDDRTRIVAASWVGYATGWRNNVAELADVAHRRGALLFLDAIQGLGVVPLNVADVPVDFLVADGHKWLLGPEGAGVMFVRGEHLEMLRPLGVGWNSVVNSGDFLQTRLTLKKSAARYEGGSHAMPGLMAFGGAMGLCLKYGVQEISRKILDVTDELCRRLQQVGAEIASCRNGERRSGIVSFSIPGVSSRKLRSACREAGVIVNCRSGRVRVSPHCYTDESDMGKLIEVVKLAQNQRD